MSVKIIELLNINILICIHKGQIENSVILKTFFFSQTKYD